jgi:hypothetical protein
VNTPQIVYRNEFDYKAYAHTGHASFGSRLVQTIDLEATREANPDLMYWEDRATETAISIVDRIGDENYHLWVDSLDPEPSNWMAWTHTFEAYLSQLETEAEIAIEEGCPTAHLNTITSYLLGGIEDPGGKMEFCLDCGKVM